MPTPTFDLPSDECEIEEAYYAEGTDPALHEFKIWEYHSCSPVDLGFFHKNGRVTLSARPKWRYYGVEVEFDSFSGRRSVRALTVWKEFNRNGVHCVIQEDGSLEHGFELITAPATYELMKNWFQEADLEYCPAETAGLHIHVTRRSISPFVLGKLLVMYNMPANLSFIWRVARRHMTEFAKATSKKITDGAAYGHVPDKYQIVNHSQGRTVEFRLFASPNNTGDVLSALEMVHASLAFCENIASATNEGLHYRNFLNWLHLPTVRKEYPNLRTIVRGL